MKKSKLNKRKAISKRLTIENCYECIHRREFFTCPASLCDLGLNLPCKACAYSKKEGKFMFFDCKYYKEHLAKRTFKK